MSGVSDPMDLAAALLADVDPLDPDDRVRRVVDAAMAAPPERRRALLTGLGSGDDHARRLAVVAARATRDGAQLAAALDDPAPAIRAGAFGSPALPEPAVAAVVERGALADRRRAYDWIRRHRRAALADRLVEGALPRWGAAEAAVLLSACSPAVVRRLLPEVAYAVPNWSGLVRRHPELVITHAGAELAACDPEARTDWWRGAGSLVGAVVDARPEAALELAERWLTGPLPWPLLTGLHRLLAVDPARVARLVRADPERVVQLGRLRLGRTARDRLAALPDAELGALLHASGPSRALLAQVLRALPPRRRAAVFERAFRGHDRATLVLTEAELTLLPRPVRAAEVERMLALPAMRDSTERTLRITALGAAERAWPALAAATRSALAEERALGYELLVRAAAGTRDPSRVAEVLAGLTRIRNEREPVRRRVLEAVAGLPSYLLTDPAVAALDTLVTDALQARDTSDPSALHRLVFGVVVDVDARRRAPELLGWALRTLERLGQWRYSAAVDAALGRLPHGAEQEVFERLRPALTAAMRRRQPWPTVAVAGALGRRGWRLPGLQELLRQATRVEQDSAIGSAVRLWLEPPGERRARVRELVRRDRSTVMLAPVLAVVVRHESDLLDRLVLRGRPLRGRFGARRAVWVPLLDPRDRARFTGRELRAYAERLRGAVADAGLDQGSRAGYARVLAGLPGGAEWVASLDPGEVLLFEAALTGLGRSDRPAEALPVLLAHTGTDRARVALYAAARCARQVRPDLLGAVLAAVDVHKVTARKEVARWRSVFRPDGAVAALLEACGRPDEHRDVRIAAVAQLREWLDDARVWPALVGAAGGDRFLAAAVLAQPPLRVAPRHRARYGELVAGLARHPDREVARPACAALAGWAPWVPTAAAELAAIVADLDGRDTWRQAAASLLTPAVWTPRPQLLPDLFGRLSAGADAEATGSDPLRDLPARQRIGYLVNGLCRAGAVARRHPDPVRAAAAVLAADATLVSAAARLLAVLVWSGPGCAAALRAVAELVADRPALVPAVAVELAVARWDAGSPAVGDPAGGTDPPVEVAPAIGTDPAAGVDPATGGGTAAGTDLARGGGPAVGVDPAPGGATDAGVDPVGTEPPLGTGSTAGTGPAVGTDPPAGASSDGPRAGASDEPRAGAPDDPRPGEAEVGAAVDELAADGRPGAGLLALHVTAGIGKTSGWPAPWRERLRRLRDHPDPEVRTAALGTYRAPE